MFHSSRFFLSITKPFEMLRLYNRQQKNIYWKEGESEEVKRWGFLSETVLPEFLSLTISHPRLHLILASLHPAGSTRLPSFPVPYDGIEVRLFGSLSPRLSVWLGCLSQIPNRLSRSSLKVKELLLCHERDRSGDKADERRNKCLAGVFVTMLKVSRISAQSNVLEGWAEKENMSEFKGKPFDACVLLPIFAFQFKRSCVFKA